MPVLVGRESGEIKQKKLLLVEGKDETVFLNALLKNQGITEQIQIIEVGGIDNFKNELPALINAPGFNENVESLAIIRDADLNYDSAFRSICSLLRNNDLPVPEEVNSFKNDTVIKIGVFIMPGNPEDGTMLEDLCLKTQKENPVMECVESFIDCLESKDIEMPRNLSKAKCQIFLASMPKIVSSVGLGAQKKYWNLDHPALEDLNGFITAL